jgi:hypothetical protein
MRIRIPDEVIELAKSEDIDERLRILWAAVVYALDKRVVVDELEELLDPNKRRRQKMLGNQNSVSHSDNSVSHTVNRPSHSVKNSVSQTVKTVCPTLKTTDTNWLNQTHEESWGFIYNNILLLDIITWYIDNNITYPSINYQIKKQWKDKFLNTQVEEAEKLIKKIWFQTFQTILQYLPHDEFWSKNILSIAKLNKKNKDGVPYYAVIMDRIKQRTPKVISIPTV